jgi:hypothetical protein
MKKAQNVTPFGTTCVHVRSVRGKVPIPEPTEPRSPKKEGSTKPTPFEELSAARDVVLDKSLYLDSGRSGQWGVYFCGSLNGARRPLASIGNHQPSRWTLANVEGTAMSGTTDAFNLKAVLFEEGDWWCAQCLEYDITAQAKTLPELRYELERVLFTHLCVSAQLGRTPFQGLAQAPRKFWKMYENTNLRLESEDSDFSFQLPGSMPIPSVIAKMKIAELADC